MTQNQDLNNYFLILFTRVCHHLLLFEILSVSYNKLFINSSKLSFLFARFPIKLLFLISWIFKGLMFLNYIAKHEGFEKLSAKI
jgi:hypothetical protein